MRSETLISKLHESQAWWSEQRSRSRLSKFRLHSSKTPLLHLIHLKARCSLTILLLLRHFKVERSITPRPLLLEFRVQLKLSLITAFLQLLNFLFLNL